MKVYLAGPIMGCTDREARDWRAEATRILGPENVLDPMVRDYRGNEDANVDVIVEGDKADIDSCTAILAYCPHPSVGTSMEILYAHERGIPVHAVVNRGSQVSPWLRYHAESVTHNVKAVATLLQAGRL